MSKLKPASLPPDTVIGGYRVVRKISAGGFGVVYLAVDKEGQQVAIKEYLPSALTMRDAGALVPQVAPEKLSLYRLGRPLVPAFRANQLRAVLVGVLGLALRAGRQRAHEQGSGRTGTGRHCNRQPKVPMPHEGRTRLAAGSLPQRM